MMGRNAISRRRARPLSARLRKLPRGSKARPYDPSVSLADPDFIREAILQSLGQGDFEAVMGIYRAHLRVLNRTKAARALNVSRQYVHKMLKPTNIPSLRTFAAFMRGLYTGML